ncbi:MAG: FixH family protein [Bergeyella sp.]
MKLNWGHGVVIALGAFILFILGMIFLFPNGQKNSELITTNYYEEELRYQDVIDAKKLAVSLTEKPAVKINPDGILITFPQDINNGNSKFRFYLYRSDDQNLDIKKEFELQGNSTLIPANVLTKGGYILKLNWTKDKQTYQIDYDIEWK